MLGEHARRPSITERIHHERKPEPNEQRRALPAIPALSAPWKGGSHHSNKYLNADVLVTTHKRTSTSE